MNNKHNHENLFQDMVGHISKFDLITKDINHTNIPDDVILIILNSKNIQCTSLYEITSITSELINEENRYGVKFYVSWPDMVNSIEVEWVINI